MLKLGIIGCGRRITHVLQVIESVSNGDAVVTCVADTDVEQVKRIRLSDEKYSHVTYYTDAEQMLKNEALDGVLIGTRCSSHAKYALLVAKYDLPLFLEKPVCTTYEDLALLKTIPHMEDKTVVSFPLRASQRLAFVKDLIDRGSIGKIAHVQACNNVTYGRGYYHKWYRDDEETGGLFLQKATHDLDYINYIVGEHPIRLCAMESKQVFKGDKPANLKCADCADAPNCPESPENIRKTGDPKAYGDYCCFAVDTGNHDSGSILVMYRSGMHAVYTQNFIVRNGAAKRGARFIGYKGTLEFDWYKDEVTLYRHDADKAETFQFPNSPGGHFGGDDALAKNFIAVMRGEEKSCAPLSQGIASAALCLGAKTSAADNKFVEL